MASCTPTIERARESMERAAYVAVGAPVAVIKSIGARVGDLRDSVRESSQDLGDDFVRGLEEWAAEGEDVVERVLRRMRRSELSVGARTTTKAAEAGVAKATTAMQNGLDLIDPDEPLSTINGIGPNYAGQLNAAGISGIAHFLRQTATSEDISTLARLTGFSSGTIKAWRDQVALTRVDGIGGVYQSQLHRLGVWTLAQLGAQYADDLTARLKEADMPDSPEQTPSIYTVRNWITDARKLVPSR